MTETKKHGLMRTLRNQFVEGLLVIIPLGATVLILIWLFTSIDNILQPFVRAIWGQTIPGVGFFATLVLIYLTGVITANFIGKRLLRWGETLLGKVPVVRPLYTGIKQILESFSAPNKTGFLKHISGDCHPSSEGLRAFAMTAVGRIATSRLHRDPQPHL